MKNGRKIPSKFLKKENFSIEKKTSLFEKIKSAILQLSPLKKTLLVFFIAFAIFSCMLFSNPETIGNDGNYHIRISEQMLENGLIFDSFKWLRFTVLNQNFVDLHFLYHVMLIPFALLGLNAGSKLSTAFLVAVFFSIFYFFLQKAQARYSLFWVFALFFSSSLFVFRMYLGRAIVLGLIFLIIQLFLIERKNYFGMALLSFLFVWAYIGFPMAILFIAFYCFAEYFFSKTFDLKMLVCSFIGTIAGLVINPYFPKNISLLYTALLQIPFLREFGNSEWGSFSTQNFFSGVFGIFVLGLILIYFLFEEKPELSKRSKILFIITVIFFVISLKVIRAVDYFVPISVLFFAFAFTDIFKNKKIRISSVKKFNFFILLVFLFLSTGFVLWENANSLTSSTETGDFKPCAEWLNNNTPKDSTVFLWYYHYFPTMYYFDANNTYTYGLDEHFGNAFDQNLFKKYKEIISTKKGIESIQTDFDSNYIFLYKKETNEADINILRANRQIYPAIDTNKCVVFAFNS